MRIGNAISILFLFILSCNLTQAQDTFTHEKTAYLSEVSDFLIDADKKEGKEFVENILTPVWNDPMAYSEQELELIYGISDLMLKKRIRAFPDFRNFLYSIAVFPSSPQKNNFEVWINTLTELINSSRKSNFTEYVAMSANLFQDNTFYKSNTTQWRSNNANFEFVLDSMPKVVFTDINLICLAKGDSSVIYATSGTFFPTREKFQGKEGKLTWERAGLDPNETFAVIQKPYELNIRGSNIELDSVLYYNSFFAYPLLGSVDDKILANVTAENASYPQFASFDKRLQIKNIVDKVDYDGGFKMEGANLQGFGTPAEPAKLTFYRENVPQLIASSQFYSIKPEGINSSDAKIEILINNDSIVHPAIRLRFQSKERLLTLVRTDEGVSKSPYYDSYHKLDLYFEALYWKIDDPVMEMGSLFGSSGTRAAFESSNYYKQNRYQALQGMDRMNPLVVIRNYAKQVNSDQFDAEGLAASMRYQLPTIIPMLIDLTNKGFISYDIATKDIVVRQRLYDYVMARAGKIDYDVLLFNSDVADGKNAKLNLINNDLMLRGVERVIVSDSQNVVIYPDNGEVIIRQNRNFNFGGVINSGKVEFFGEEYAFNYDKFEIDLVAVDSCRLYVDEITTETSGRKRLVRVKNVIEGMAGTLQIDNPFNKSGFQDEFTEYPILNSVKESFVFYDNANIQGGVYDRNKVNFQLEPFVLDSLDNFNTDNIFFTGEFKSGGIFPDLAQDLKVQDDYSLGFVRSTPSEGMAVYGNKARFTNDIVLNYNGLQGDGALEYRSSISESEEFVFFPDSTKGLTKSFINTAQTTPPEIPEVNAEAVNVLYKPGSDELVASVHKQPMNMFNGQSTLEKGNITLQPSGLTGSGIMAFSGAELEAELLTYKLNSFDSDTADFRLASLSESALAFKTNNVNAHIDFDERLGDFKSNGEETFVEFPVNQYVCYMDEFKWFMDKNDIALETSREVASDFVIDTELNLNRSNFYSINPDQDSLNFMAPKAIYDLDSYIITADQIEWIQVADAKIVPDSGRVTIRRRAKMDELTDARVIANSVTQYHEIFDADITISSRKDYSGKGKYNYVDENKLKKTLMFNDLGVDSTMQTYATGSISESDNFNLSPHFAFQGDVTMQANNQHLFFDGSTRIIHDCEGLEKNWMKFATLINPSEILIPVDTALFDNRGNIVEVGINLTRNPFDLYGTFLSKEKEEEDVNIITSRGYLTYDKANQTYEVSTKEQIREQSLPGNYVSLSSNGCKLYGEGELQLGEEKLGQFDLRTLGSLNYEPVEEKTTIHAAMSINFFFNEDAIEKMETYFSALPNLKPLEIQKSKYEMAIKELMGLEKSDKVISELNLSGGLKRLPDDLSKTFFIADVKLNWDPVSEAFVSEGEIGIASILDKQFFRYIPGKIVIEKMASGDIVHIYFENDEENWYYFNYKRGLLQAYSSDKEFNNIIMETKSDKRKLAGDKKEEDYSYMLGSRAKQTSFLDSFMFD